MRLTCARTVGSLTAIRSAISWLLRPCGNQPQHRHLARRERLGGGFQLGRVGDLLQQLACDGRMEGRLAAMHLADGPHELVRGGVFEQITHSPGFDGRKHLVVGGKAGQHEDACFRVAARDLPRRLDAIHHRHQQVHQDHVGPRFFGVPHRFLPVADLCHHLEAIGFGEQGPDALAHDGMVVGNHDTNTRVFSCHSVTSTFTRVPSPGLLSQVSVPPRRAARSVMLRSPTPPRPAGGMASGSKPTPSSRTSRQMLAGV